MDTDESGEIGFDEFMAVIKDSLKDDETDKPT